MGSFDPYLLYDIQQRKLQEDRIVFHKPVIIKLHCQTFFCLENIEVLTAKTETSMECVGQIREVMTFQSNCCLLVLLILLSLVLNGDE